MESETVDMSGFLFRLKHWLCDLLVRLSGGMLKKTTPKCRFCQCDIRGDSFWVRHVGSLCAQCARARYEKETGRTWAEGLESMRLLNESWGANVKR